MRMKRRNNFVDSSVQGALLRRIFTHWIVFFFVTALSIVALQTLLGDPTKPLVERLQVETGEFVLIGIVMLALLPAFMLDTVRFSNRFVGPILRVRRHLRELGSEQKTEHCSFRDNDFWIDMANEFNKVVELVEQQKAEILELREKTEAVEAE